MPPIGQRSRHLRTARTAIHSNAVFMWWAEGGIRPEWGGGGGVGVGVHVGLSVGADVGVGVECGCLEPDWQLGMCIDAQAALYGYQRTEQHG